jgi:predicted ester cyclase
LKQSLPKKDILGGNMLTDNKALIRRWFEEVWNQGRAELIDEMLEDSCVAHGLPNERGEELRGLAEFKPFFNSFRKAFPDIKIIVEDVIGEGDKLAARCVVRGLYKGEGVDTDSLQPIEISGICMLQLKNGKIVEAWNNFDFMGLYKQVGKGH